MPGQGPILYITDDADDHFLLETALKEIGSVNSLLSFSTADKVIDYLKRTKDKPFIILCDLRIQGMSGLELKDYINQDDDLKKKSIPFIFLSEVINPKDVETAYMQLVQGFYKKEAKYDELKQQLSAILEYWTRAIHPTTEL